MRALWSLGLGVALLVLTAFLIFTDQRLLFRPLVERGERPQDALSPERVLSRIQADLERVAVGDLPWPVAPGAVRDPLEELVPALDAVLRGRTVLAHDYLSGVRAEALRRLAAQGKPPSQVSVARSGGPSPLLLELVQTMRLADAALASDGVRLRLPCPLIRGRRAVFEAMAADLGDLAGPLLSCPLPREKERDFALMERLAIHPGGFAAFPVFPPVSADPFPSHPPGPPWDQAAALRFMDVNPDAAEPALRFAVLNGGPTARLDLALFLHAFRDPSPARNEEIRGLVAAVDGLSQAARQDGMAPPIPYDGSDASLVPSLRLAAVTRVAEAVSGSYRYPYPIPCAVLSRHPGLAEAETGDGGEGGGALSGCLVGRGRTEHFPESDLAAFVNATAATDGARRGKLPRYPVEVGDAEVMADILFRPRALLGGDDPGPDHPYQTWAYASVGNHEVAGRLKGLYQTARTSLSLWFRGKGLAEAEAAAAARRALFRLAHGGGCGHAPPPASLRRAVMDGAPVMDLAAVLSVPPERLEPFTGCAAETPFDPLSHVAVLHPALPLLWRVAEAQSSEADPEGLRSLLAVNGRNVRGETPLMVAAAADRAEAVSVLLDHGARVNAESRSESRTALILASAHGSAATIRLLLDGGADRFQSDARGYRALHYLLGLGPLPANPRLSEGERRELSRRLY